MEGAAYIVAANPGDAATRDYVDWFVGAAAKAQELADATFAVEEFAIGSLLKRRIRLR